MQMEGLEINVAALFKVTHYQQDYPQAIDELFGETITDFILPYKGKTIKLSFMGAKHVGITIYPDSTFLFQQELLLLQENKTYM